MNKVYFDTLGCFKNIEDSERAAGILKACGYSIIDDVNEADIIIVNTCGFIEDAKRESIDHILENAIYHDLGKIIIVTGCLTQRYPEELFNDFHEVDAILGVNDYENLPDIIERISSHSHEETSVSNNSAKPRVMAVSNNNGILTGPREAFSSRASAFLKISEGCSNRCTYCAIPSIRGPFRSIPKDLVLEDANTLATEGTKELVLIAQDVSAYGMDFDNEPNLTSLLTDLSLIDSIEWLRLMYCYEERITEELVDLIASNPKICRYIDIPLQHVSDPILIRMNRHSTNERIRRTISNLRDKIPEIAIRTTLMTGFPGETDEDFEELYNFVEDHKFERLGVFAFSPEEGTPAFNMPDQVPKEIAEQRRDAIMQLQVDISLANNQKLVGKKLKVLVEEKEDDGTTYVGRSEFDAPEIDNSVIIGADKELKIGDFVDVIITDAMDYDIIGEVI